MNRLQASLHRALYGSGFLHGVLVLGGGTALGQVLVVLTAPILSRLYTPADYGALAVYTSILTLVAVVASLRYEQAIPLPEDDETAANLLLLALVLVVGMCVLTGVVLLSLGGQIVAWANAPSLQPYLWLLPLGLLGTGVYQVLSYWAVRKQAFGRLARTRLGQSLGQVITQVALGLLRLGPVGLLFGYIVGQVGGSGTLAVPLLNQDRPAMRKISRAGIRWAAYRYRRFPLLSSASALLNSAGLQLPPLLVAAFYGPEAAGWFALGRRVIKMPMTLVGQAVAQVYLGEAARLATQDPKALYRLFLKTTGRLALVGSLPILIIGLGGPALFALIFGEPWRQAGLYVQILAAMYAVQFAVVPPASTLNVVERQDLQLAWDAGRSVLSVGSLLLAKAKDWSDVQAIAVYGASMLLAYLALFALTATTLAKLPAAQDGASPPLPRGQL